MSQTLEDQSGSNDNIKIPSENSADLIPFLQRIKKQYGIPKAVVADMGKGIHCAVEAFDKSQRPVVAVYEILIWTLDYQNDSEGYGFPFDRPHFQFYQRLTALQRHVKQILLSKVKGYPDNARLNNSLYKLFRRLNEIMADQNLSKAAQTIANRITVFDKLRHALRIAQPDGKKGLNDNGEYGEMSTIKESVTAFRNWMSTEKNYSEKIEFLSMIDQIERYWDKLFADPIEMKTSNGPIMVQPQRTNNILERFFRDFKRSYRKRNGCNSMNRILKAMLADTPLVKNLHNPGATCRKEKHFVLPLYIGHDGRIYTVSG